MDANLLLMVLILACRSIDLLGKVVTLVEMPLEGIVLGFSFNGTFESATLGAF